MTTAANTISKRFITIPPLGKNLGAAETLLDATQQFSVSPSKKLLLLPKATTGSSGGDDEYVAQRAIC